MSMLKKILFLLVVISFSIVSANSQNILVVPSGRILFDGAVFSNGDLGFTDGVTMPDVRMGIQLKHKSYKAKVDIGYAYGKVSLKDIYVERGFNDRSFIRLGYFEHQYGLQSATRTAMKTTMIEPVINEPFFTSRLLGTMFVFSPEKFHTTFSLYAEKEAMKRVTNEAGKQGFGFMGRFVYRPFYKDGKIFHIGISAGFDTPEYHKDEKLRHSSFVLTTHFPTKVSKIEAQSAVVSDAKNMFKFSPELCLAYKRVALESQYYYGRIHRSMGKYDYTATGGYALIRTMLLGDDYVYSRWDSGISAMAPKSLELTLGYTYSDLNDDVAGIKGGIMNDYSLTLNYYITKYTTCRLRYSYSKTTGRKDPLNTDIHMLQTRLQFVF